MRRCALCLLLLVLAWPAWAAVTANSPVTPQTPTAGVVQFLQGTDTAGTYKTIYTANVTTNNGAKCYSLELTTNDLLVAHVVTVQVVVTAGGVRYGGTAITTVVGAGFDGVTPPLDLFSASVWPSLPTDSDGNPFVFLAPGQTLQATYATALTAGTVINLRVQCAEF